MEIKINKSNDINIILGSTPARREFQYPRYLVATSPHERIIKRFREVRRGVEISEDDVIKHTFLIFSNINTKMLFQDTLEFSTPKISANLTVENSIMSPMNDKKNHVTSTPNTDRILRYKSLCNNSNLIKSASTSDIPIAGVAQLDSTVMSESELSKVYLRLEQFKCLAKHSKFDWIIFFHPLSH